MSILKYLNGYYQVNIRASTRFPAYGILGYLRVLAWICSRVFWSLSILRMNIMGEYMARHAITTTQPIRNSMESSCQETDLDIIMLIKKQPTLSRSCVTHKQCSMQQAFRCRFRLKANVGLLYIRSESATGF